MTNKDVSLLQITRGVMFWQKSSRSMVSHVWRQNASSNPRIEESLSAVSRIAPKELRRFLFLVRVP